MTKCEPRARLQPRTFSMVERRTPYRVLRDPSNAAATAPAQMLPPAPTTPTSANCDAPVNMRSDSAPVWRTDSPAAVAIAPNEMAYAPLAMAIATASRTMPRVGDLDLAVGPRGRAKQRRVGSCTRLRRAGRENRRPESCAARVARRGGAGVRDEEIDRFALLIDEDLPKLRVVCDRDLLSCRGLAWARACGTCGRARSATCRGQQ